MTRYPRSRDGYEHKKVICVNKNVSGVILYIIRV